MQTILSVCVEPALLYTRGLVLARTGAVIRSAHPTLAFELVQESAFGVIVLCHSLRQGEADAMCSVARACSPTSRILLMESLRAANAVQVEPDKRFMLEDGPEALVRAVQLLMNKSHSPAERDGCVGLHEAADGESYPAEAARQSAVILPFRGPTEPAAVKQPGFQSSSKNETPAKLLGLAHKF